MPFDLQSFQVALTGKTVTVSLPEVLITGKFVNPDTQAVVADLSAASNGASIPTALEALTPDQFLALIQPSAVDFLTIKAGLL